MAQMGRLSRLFSFNMYPDGDLNAKGWNVTVKGTPVGNLLDGMALIGEIDTEGKFELE